MMLPRGMAAPLLNCPVSFMSLFCFISPRVKSDALKRVDTLRLLGETMNIEEASKKVFEENMMRFENDTKKALINPEDRKALEDMISEWKRLGEPTLLKLSMNQPWNMPQYFALSAAILNRREINELRKSLKSG